ncbi:MAG: hypothetical protein HXY34_09035 [Candidatus Thorarchaeota archaeon]|nr:hypothetical protein [Candidatus Thorarchaeota archaeon]
MDVKSLYIIKRESGVCLYHRDFEGSTFDPHLISSFLVAMTSFFDESAHSAPSTARAFEGSDYRIMVEFGTWTMGAISVDSEKEHLREKLRRLIQRFEEQFSLLRYVDLDLAVYTRFERNVIEEFVRYQVDPDAIIRPCLNWDLFVRNQEVSTFLKLIPQNCTVAEAAEYLEMPLEVAMNIVAEALWEKAVTLVQQVKPDDIYQATSLMVSPGLAQELPEEARRALPELDGETPLSIAAERVNTTDLKRFLEEIAKLAERRAVERVSPSQTKLVLYGAVIQSLLNRIANLIGYKATRRIFFDSREALSGPHPWLLFVDLEERVDVEVRSSLTAACVKGRLSPDILSDGFRALLQFISKRFSAYVGSKVANSLISGTREELQTQFPNLAYDVEWEQIRT